eukprot:5901104-Pyramimonas_sp.AAC.1
MTRAPLDNLIARLRDHHREGSGVPHARKTLTCILPLVIDIRDIAGGAMRATTIGNVRAVRRSMGKNKPGHVLTPGKCKFCRAWGAARQSWTDAA